MPRKCRAAVLEAPNRIALREFDIPQIGPEEGLLRVEMVGVCGTDPKLYHGQIWVKDPAECLPMILGHEILGWIEEIGPAAAQRYQVKKGDRVVVEAHIGCGACYYCLAGSYQFCENDLGYGTRISIRVSPALWGAYSEYMYLAPRSQVYRISDSVPAEAAVLTCAVVANGIQWVRYLGGASIGQCVVIQGTGQQGLAATVAALESGASPIIVTGLSRDSQRLAVARELGATYTVDVEKEDLVARVREFSGGKMADLVVDVTGSSQAIQKSIDLVRPQGTVVLAGVTGGNIATPIITDKFVLNEIRLQGARNQTIRAVLAAIKLVESRKYPLERMVSHHYPLERAEEAVRAVGGDIPGVYPTKAVIVP